MSDGYTLNMRYAKFIGIGAVLVAACSSAAQQSTPQPAPSDVVADLPHRLGE